MKNYTFCETIRSIYWNIVNFFLSIRYYIKRNKVDYNSLYSDISKKWNIIDEDLLKDKNRWNILEEGNWGSARPDNISVARPTNIIFNEDNNLSIINKYEPDSVTGKDWDGNPVTRYFSSGSISTKDFFEPIGKRFSLWCDLVPGVSTWPAFWLFYADESVDDKQYFEIDGFERFPNQNKLTFTVHWGPSDARKMYNRSVKYKGDSISFLNCIVVDRGKVKVYVNNILVFITSLGYPKEEYKVCCIISDSVNDDSGKINHDEITNELPINFHSKNLIIWEKK